MSNSTTRTDIFFAEFDGQTYAFGLSADATREAIESSCRFGPPSGDGQLGDSWAITDSDAGWRVIRRSLPVIRLDVKFVGKAGDTNHVSWQCPRCEAWSFEDVEHDATGPLLVHCGSRHHDDDGVWVILTW